MIVSHSCVPPDTRDWWRHFFFFFCSVLTLIASFSLLGLLLLSGASCAQHLNGEGSIDVEEGDNVRLECRFAPSLAVKASTLYWIRTNRNGHDNVAIGDTPFQGNYRCVRGSHTLEDENTQVVIFSRLVLQQVAQLVSPLLGYCIACACMSSGGGLKATSDLLLPIIGRWKIRLRNRE